MAGCTEAHRLLALALCAALVAPATGCATGVVAAIGQRTERVAWFRAARTDGEQLWLSYEAELRDADRELVGTRERAVVLRVADLDPELGIPIEDFPLRHLDPDEIPIADTQTLPLLVARRGGVDVGFRIASLDGAPEQAHFHSAALTRRTTAGWAFALYPFAVLWDAVAIPFLAVLAVPVFGWTD